MLQRPIDLSLLTPRVTGHSNSPTTTSNPFYQKENETREKVNKRRRKDRKKERKKERRKKRNRNVMISTVTSR